MEDDKNTRANNPSNNDNPNNTNAAQRASESTPESGAEAGAGISNAQFIKEDYDQGDEAQTRPSEAGINMAEIRKKMKENTWGSTKGTGIQGSAGSEAGT